MRFTCQAYATSLTKFGDTINADIYLDAIRANRENAASLHSKSHSD
jgi:hypothetical protein